MRTMLYFIGLVLCFVVGNVVSQPLFAPKLGDKFKTLYWPKMKELFIKEGDDKYPVPPSNKIKDLLPGLKGVQGLAVHTAPDTTVTEGQGYAMFAAGMGKDVDSLKGLTVTWQGIGQGFDDTDACGGCGVNNDQYFDAKDICTGKFKTPCLCNTVKGAYMPGWLSPFTTPGSMGSATDGDEDAVTGLIYLAELTGKDEFREYAVKSIAAFVLEDLGYAAAEKNSRPVPVKGDIPKKHQTMYLWRGGTCWGGYDTSSPNTNDRNLCINPAYFSPGQWRLFKKYLVAHSRFVPKPHTAEKLGAVLESAIVWGYNTINRITCDTGLVSNWWTVPDKDWPWKGGLECKNSGTESGAYYSDAARIPWRVALDYVWFSDEATAPLYDEQGKQKGTWGAKEYSNRWASSWKQAIIDASPKGSYPPLQSGVLKLRKDQVLPLLTNLKTCDACPKGFTAPPWNAWGSMAVSTAFQVPLDGVDKAEMQEWTEFIADLSGQCSTGQYFDLGQQIVVSNMLGGQAWMPLDKGSSNIARKYTDSGSTRMMNLDVVQHAPAVALTAFVALSLAFIAAIAARVRAARVGARHLGGDLHYQRPLAPVEQAAAVAE